MKFGEALDLLKMGKKVSRLGWNGKNMSVYYVPYGEYKPCTNVGEQLVNEKGLVPYLPYIALKTVHNEVVPWCVSQTDVLANDWMVVE